MKIYLKQKPKNIKDLLKIFFSHQSYGVMKGICTYQDKACSKVQCPAGRYRSFDDLYDCAKTYFPTITPKRLIHEVTTARLKQNTGKIVVFRMFHCHTMGRIRLCMVPSFQD